MSSARMSSTTSSSTTSSSTTAYETCDECGFDASLWTHQDAIETVWMAGPLASVAADVDGQVANTRPDLTTWSIAEYIEHISDVFELIAHGAEFTVENHGSTVDLPDRPGFDPTARQIDFRCAAKGH